MSRIIVDRRQPPTSSPGHSKDVLRSILDDLHDNTGRVSEAVILQVHQHNLIPNSFDFKYGTSKTGLFVNGGVWMNTDSMPRVRNPSGNLITPVPDMLFGYYPERKRCFTAYQLRAIKSAYPGDGGKWVWGTKAKLLFPFMVVEGKSGAQGQSMPIAERQLATAMVISLNIVHKLNKALSKCRNSSGVKPVEECVYGLAIDGNSARIHVTTFDKGPPRTHSVHRLVDNNISGPVEHRKTRSQLRNIVTWGVEYRLQAIKYILDLMAEEAREDDSEDDDDENSGDDDGRNREDNGDDDNDDNDRNEGDSNSNEEEDSDEDYEDY